MGKPQFIIRIIPSIQYTIGLSGAALAPKFPGNFEGRGVTGLFDRIFLVRAAGLAVVDPRRKAGSPASLIIRSPQGQRQELTVSVSIERATQLQIEFVGQLLLDRSHFDDVVNIELLIHFPGAKAELIRQTVGHKAPINALAVIESHLIDIPAIDLAHIAPLDVDNARIVGANRKLSRAHDTDCARNLVSILNGDHVCF